MPTLPHILLRVLDMCNNDEASLQTIADLISKDAALSSKVLGASSTAQFSRQNKFVSFAQNLSLLGLDMVKTIAISSSFYQVFNNIGLTPGFNLKIFWGRSLTTAVLAKLIAKEISYPHPEEAYLTGLMLDIGQLVLWSNFPKQYAALLADKDDSRPLLVRESEKLGNNHCELGSSLVNNWNLNSFMADAVLYHHMPQEYIADAHTLIQIAHVANSLALMDADRILAGEQLLGISPANFQKIIENARVLVANIALSLGIEIDTTLPVSDAQLDKPDLDDMRQKKMQLAIELRDIVLIGRNPLSAGTTGSIDETLSSIQRTVQILFGFQNLVFFLPDQLGRTLKGRCLSGQGLLINEMNIPLNKGNSIITEAFLSKTPNSSFASGDKLIPSILDEQVIRLMETEGFYCQPLFTQSATVGILLFGISNAQLANIKKQQKLISMFAQQSAQALTLLNAFDKQETRIKAEMMATAQTHAQQIAHEANKPLSIIKNYMQLLGDRLSKEDRAQDDLKIIQEEINRVSRIFKQVTLSADNGSNLWVEMNANDVIRDVCKISSEALFSQHQLTIETQFEPALPNIVSNKDKLIQVLINLMKNAAEAMPNGGKLLISTDLNKMRGDRDYIEISLKDTGPGIPQVVMDNLFRPVASSKGIERAGLGLSIVKNLVDELQGKIFCQSNKMTGTAFQILLPMKAGNDE